MHARSGHLAIAVLLLGALVIAGPGRAGQPPDAGPPRSPAGSGDAAHVGSLAGAGPFQRFIVKYRDGSVPAADPAAVQARLDATVARAPARLPAGLELEWARRLGVGADVVTASRPLDRREATQLMEQFAADPQVEYIEVDAMMARPPAPPARPLDG